MQIYHFLAIVARVGEMGFWPDISAMRMYTVSEVWLCPYKKGPRHGLWRGGWGTAWAVCVWLSALLDDGVLEDFGVDG